MLLWPSKNYADNLEKAILSGEVPMSRLDDAVTRILRVKERRGLFDENKEQFHEISDEERSFINDFKTRCFERSITLIRDRNAIFPMNLKENKKIAIFVICEYAPALEEAKALKLEFEKRGFEVEYKDDCTITAEALERCYKENDIVLWALFSRPFRPIGFLDYTSIRASLIKKAFFMPDAVDKVAVVSFGSPYFGDQYFEKAQTYVNAYSMLASSAEAFVKAACGETNFEGKSPVKLDLNDKI
jgi:beta-glucosidase-like glycosyl hydrolase